MLVVSLFFAKYIWFEKYSRFRVFGLYGHFDLIAVFFFLGDFEVTYLSFSNVLNLMVWKHFHNLSPFGRYEKIWLSNPWLIFYFFFTKFENLETSYHFILKGCDYKVQKLLRNLCTNQYIMTSHCLFYSIPSYQVRCWYRQSGGFVHQIFWLPSLKIFKSFRIIL